MNINQRMLLMTMNKKYILILLILGILSIAGCIGQQNIGFENPYPQYEEIKYEEIILKDPYILPSPGGYPGIPGCSELGERRELAIMTQEEYDDYLNKTYKNGYEIFQHNKQNFP